MMALELKCRSCTVQLHLCMRLYKVEQILVENTLSTSACQAVSHFRQHS